MQPLITVIVPVYGVEKYLPRCVDSILNQTYKNLEIILVDDGSKDNCAEICDQYSIKDSRIKVIHKPNGGLSSARNAGLDIAQGLYIGFVDGDDYIDPEMYYLLLNELEKTQSDIAVCGIKREKVETGEFLEIRTPKVAKTYSTSEALKEIFLSREIGISVWSKLYKKDIFRSVRFPVGENNEDAAIVLDTLLNKKIVHIGKSVYHYIYRENSITGSYSTKTANDFWRHSIKIVEKVNETIPEINKYAKYYFCEGMFTLLYLYCKQRNIVDSNYPLYLSYL